MSSPLRPSAVTPVSLGWIAELVGGTVRPSSVSSQEAAPSGAAAGGDTEGLAQVQVRGVGLDSRAAQPGDLYAALPGSNAHGASYAAGALAAGAVAVLTDDAGVRLLAEAGLEQPVPVVVVADPRAVLGGVAALIYGHPAEKLELVGITGTNGKTTTAYLVEAALRALGRRTGLIGTIETRVGERSVPSVRTTPESPDLHGLFAVMVEAGVQACVMEVSSHALALHRVDGAIYDVAVFTNLSQDHLDFHGSMEDYFRAKAELFTPARARRGVVCVDDEWGARLARQAGIPVVTVATRADAAGEADWHVRPGASATTFELVGPEGSMTLEQALPGDHNRANASFAALSLLALGVPASEVERALTADARVPGRVERIDLPGDAPAVYVDFAHTPDGIVATLDALRPVAQERGGRLIAVVGAGGHRDRGKRPLMGGAAARGADVVVVTDDNPRDEDPAAIRADVAAGARGALDTAEPGELGRDADGRVLDVDGRLEGIAAALGLAGPGDVVAVLGRGHETKQEVMGEFRPFDDRLAVPQAWALVADRDRAEAEA